MAKVDHLHATALLQIPHEVAEMVDALTPDSINAYLATHRPSDFMVTTLGPEPLEMPVGIS